MPISITRLDTTTPTLWESYWGGENPLEADPFTDAATAMRVSEGTDKVNVYTRQRVEGDLFVRDLRLELGLRHLNNFVGNRGVLSLNMPNVRLPVNESISLGQLPSNEVTKWGYIGVGLTATGAAEIELYNVTGSTSVYTNATSAFRVNTDPATTSPTHLAANNVYEIRVKNKDVTPIVVSAWVMAVPHA